MLKEKHQVETDQLMNMMTQIEMKYEDIRAKFTKAQIEENKKKIYKEFSQKLQDFERQISAYKQ